MNLQHYLKPLAALACAAWCTSFAHTDTTGLGLVELHLDDARTGATVAPLAFDGKLVLLGGEIAGGQLSTEGRGLVLFNGEGQPLNYENLVFAFDGEGGGTVHSGSTQSRRLFDLTNITVQVHPDESALLVADMQMAGVARILGKPQMEGVLSGALAITASADAVRFQTVRETILPEPAGTAEASAGGTPDVIVWDIGVNGGDTNDIHYWGQNPAGTKQAYSIATQSCNAGTALLDWQDSGGQTTHPVIGQNMFRLKDGRFEHIGQSWLKHGFCAVNEFETGCGPCGGTDCDTLGIGCADTYWATLNDGRGGGSKSFVNAAAGTHTEGSPAPTGNNTVRGRLQVATEDIDPAQNVGASYFIECQYVTADDAAANAADNNATWRPINVNSIGNLTGAGGSVREESAIRAWQDADPGVTVHTSAANEGSIRTYFYLGTRATDNGDGTWHYEYAIQNHNSDQSAGSFFVPVDPGVNITNIGFHDVEYHSGDPYDGTDWVATVDASGITWATDDHATNANANALRWGTLYNFRFDADTPPSTGMLELGMFKPGPLTSRPINNALAPSTSCSAFIAARNAGNPDSYTSNAPVLGGTVTATVDLTTTGHDNAALFGFTGQISLSLAGGVLLADVTHPDGELLALPAMLSPGSTAQWIINVPNNVDLCGLNISTQALHFGGIIPYALSNAQDWIVGN